MSMTVPLEKYHLVAGFLVLGIICLITSTAIGGSYLDSAHGNSSYGVNRSTIDGKYTETEFATGNCAHCHETHASLAGEEPSPVTGPAPHTLFADSCNTSCPQNPYQQTDSSNNFCFYCHNKNSGPLLTNQDYSTTFGGATNGSGPQSILDAFNLVSYHNLTDIYNFLSNNQTYNQWFAKRGNPCSACHNSHLAKRNWDSTQPEFPLLSAISQPGSSDNLWGENEVMSTYIINYLDTSYEAPYSNPLTDAREPGGVFQQDGNKTPDYVTFCISCHNPDNIIWSTTLSRELKKINWDNSGINPAEDKHGTLTRDGTDIFRDPYAAVAASNSNFVLSCLDCHEPHGSGNIMLFRRRINGENLEGTVNSTDAMGYVCRRCHLDDLTAPAGSHTGQVNRWQYVHHSASGAPYIMQNCTNCHGVGGGGGARLFPAATVMAMAWMTAGPRYRVQDG